MDLLLRSAATLVCILVAVVLKILLEAKKLQKTKPYVVVKTGEVRCETRPLSDMVSHVVIFKWLAKLLGTDSKLFGTLLMKINQPFLLWDVSFTEQGKDPEEEVMKFCDHWGVQKAPWVWAKQPSEFTCGNDFFARGFAPEFGVEKNLGQAAIVSPATAVVTWFDKTVDIPVRVKNDKFTIDDTGIPNHEAFLNGSAAFLYLAPADYHCYHFPISGKITHLELLSLDSYSVTVKSYIFSSVNILRRNRRAVVVVETEAPSSSHIQTMQVALVIVGGVTVDSIRIEDGLRKGVRVKRGQKIGAFARGGSFVGAFFSRPVKLDAACQKALADVGKGEFKFKLDCGASLATL